MNHAAEYKTKQKEMLESYMSSMSGVHVTVNELVAHFANSDMELGTTTIYRHLEKMVAEGSVKKYSMDGISGACFEYVNEDDHVGEKCFHLKCEKCGKLIHFHCEELEQLHQHLSEAHGFEISSPKTVFYGICDQCSVKQK